MGGHDNKTSRDLAYKLSTHRQRELWNKPKKSKSRKAKKEAQRKRKKAQSSAKKIVYTQAFKTRQNFGAASKGRSLSKEEIKEYIASLEEK